MGMVMRSFPADGPEQDAQRRLCAEFVAKGGRPKYILGRNIYADCVAGLVDVDGFIDDYATIPEYRGKPVRRLGDVPAGALVLNAAGGRPLSARRRLDDAGLDNVDYFTLYRFSGLPLVEMRFNEGFAAEFAANRASYDWIHDRFHDDESRRIFAKLVAFRADYDIRHLDGFSWREDVQYFEDFLALRPDGESFVDVGGYNGFTSLEFIKRCPSYRSIDIFEPEPANHDACTAALAGRPNVRIHRLGASSARATLYLESQGSASRVSKEGGLRIEVDRIDTVLDAAGCTPTFLKMDIEGEEPAAIAGAAGTIARFGPRLALSVYHKAGDFWQIPRQVLAIRDDYDIYLRHYTECIYETVMFFVPKAGRRQA